MMFIMTHISKFTKPATADRRNCCWSMQDIQKLGYLKRKFK